ncbi:MAG: hypothetical protein ACE5EF_08470 [Dehalococcoidia bacterium]
MAVADDFVVKPFDFGSFNAMLDRLLQGRPTWASRLRGKEPRTLMSGPK